MLIVSGGEQTVHGAIIIYPKHGTSYPFPLPHAEFPIILGEWWKEDIGELYDETVQTGGAPNVSDAFTINGQPGDLYSCSKPETFKLKVDHGKTYLLRLIMLQCKKFSFSAIAKHNVTVVGVDASYTKPLEASYVAISPGQTVDVLLKANEQPDRYYMAARVYSGSAAVAFDNTTTTAVVQYSGNYTPSSPPSLPYLPYYNDTNAEVRFTRSLKSLADENHPIEVPINITTKLFFVISVNTFPCPNNSCEGPNDFPPLIFDFTAEYLPLYLETPKRGTKVKILDYNTTVEIVFQGTNLVGGNDHPMHLHGYSFFVVGSGLGNFDKDKDPLGYNLVDPPLQNTIAVPLNGWTTIRFKADNPGVWFMHCHFDRHMTWGMDMAFVVKMEKAQRRISYHHHRICHRVEV
ncbi:hypothetical protein SLA2020_423240 [Shorea laevis]